MVTSIALAFARSGYAQILIADSDLQMLQACHDEVIQRHPSVKVHVEAFDRSSETDVDRFFGTVGQHLKRIDCAVNVVSQTQGSQVDRGLSSIEQYDGDFAVYQRGVGTTTTNKLFEPTSMKLTWTFLSRLF